MTISTRKQKLRLITSVLIGSVFFSFPALAGTVLQVKNNKALINLDGGTASVGEELYIVNSAGKKIGIVVISQVKNGKAIGALTKGKANINDTTESKGGTATAANSGESSKVIRNNMMKLGVNLKIMMNTIVAKQQDNSTFPIQEDVSMKGTNFGIMGTLDYPLSNFIARGTAGYEMLDVSGSAVRQVCAAKTSQNCDAKINYLAFGAYARYDFTKGQMVWWAGAGGTIKMPLSKQSSSLTEGDIKMSNSIAVTGGLDYQLNNKYFIPVSAEYHYSLNKSDTVPTIDQMVLQAGFGMMY